MKFTKEEINLCKQVAEKYVKEIHHGVWVAKEKGKTIEVSLWTLPIGVTEKVRKEGKWTPLWTISDCLEWLKERYDEVDLGSIQGEWDAQVQDAYDKVHYPVFLEDIRGKTPLEACLKVVLAVLEEVKK